MEYIQQISQLSAYTFGVDKYDSLRKSGQMKKVDQEIIDLAIDTLMQVNDEKDEKEKI
jgi:hypothetical protein